MALKNKKYENLSKLTFSVSTEFSKQVTAIVNGSQNYSRFICEAIIEKFDKESSFENIDELVLKVAERLGSFNLPVNSQATNGVLQSTLQSPDNINVLSIPIQSSSEVSEAEKLKKEEEEKREESRKQAQEASQRWGQSTMEPKIG